MALDTSIHNIGDYYAAHYLDSQFQKDVEPILKAWRPLGSASPARRLAALSEPYFRAKSQALDYDQPLLRGEGVVRLDDRLLDHVAELLHLALALAAQGGQAGGVDAVGLEQAQHLVHLAAVVAVVALERSKDAVAGGVERGALLRRDLGVIEHLVNGRADEALHDRRAAAAVTPAGVGAAEQTEAEQTRERSSDDTDFDAKTTFEHDGLLE